jgi:hypothetical protein
MQKQVMNEARSERQGEGGWDMAEASNVRIKSIYLFLPVIH